MTPRDDLLEQIEYERDSFGKILDALESCASGDSEDSQKARSIAAHTVATRHAWLLRLVGSDEPLTKDDVFPGPAPIATTRTQLVQADRDWRAFADGVTEQSLARVIDYTTSGGDAMRNTEREILRHVYGHSMYHRGQLSSLITRLGGEVPWNDYIFYARSRHSS